MEYKGKLYAKINGKYIQCTESVEQLESRIKELENNTTELSDVFSNEYGYIMECNSCKYHFSTDFQSQFNYCPNCGRKIIRN